MTTAFKIVNESHENSDKVIVISRYAKPNHLQAQTILYAGQTSETMHVWPDVSYTIEEMGKEQIQAL